MSLIYSLYVINKSGGLIYSKVGALSLHHQRNSSRLLFRERLLLHVHTASTSRFQTYATDNTPRGNSNTSNNSTCSHAPAGIPYRPAGTGSRESCAATYVCAINLLVLLLLQEFEPSAKLDLNDTLRLASIW